MLVREGRKILIDCQKRYKTERRVHSNESTIRIFSSNVETIYKAVQDPVFLKTLHDTLGISPKHTVIKFDSSKNTLTIKSGLSFYPQADDMNWDDFRSLFQIDYDVSKGKLVRLWEGTEYWKYGSDRKVLWTIDPKNISVSIEKLVDLKKSYNGILPSSRETSFQTKDAKDIARAIHDLTIEAIKSKCSSFDASKFAPEKLREENIIKSVNGSLISALKQCGGFSSPKYYYGGDIYAKEWIPLSDTAWDDWDKYRENKGFDAKSVLLDSFIPLFSFQFWGDHTNVSAEFNYPLSIEDNFSIDSHKVKRIINKGTALDGESKDRINTDDLVSTINDIKKECIDFINKQMEKMGINLKELKIDLHKIDVETLLDKLSGFSSSANDIGARLGITEIGEIFSIMLDLNMVSNGYKKYSDGSVTYFISYPVKVNGKYELMPMQVHFDAKTKSFIRSSANGEEIFKKELKNGVKTTADEFEDVLEEVIDNSEPEFKKVSADKSDNDKSDNKDASTGKDAEEKEDSDNKDKEKDTKKKDKDSDKSDSKSSKDKGGSKDYDSKSSQYDFIQKLVVNNPNINKTYGKGTGVRWDKDAQYFAFQMKGSDKVGHVKVDGDKAKLVVGRKLLDTVDLAKNSIKDAVSSLRDSLDDYATA